MSIGWYVKRLAAMSPPELVHRVGEQAKRRISKRRRYGWEAFAPKGRMVPIPGLVEQLRAGADEAFRAALREATASLLAGRFSAHGVDWPVRGLEDPFPAAMWRLDPVTGKSWPGAEVYCFAIPYRHARDIGDVKYVWDYNRLQFLQPLAASVALDGDGDALQAIERAVTSWKAANPPFGGLAWNSGIELALRAVTLVLVDSLCGERLPAGTRHDIHAILKAHLHWMRRYPSRFSSANNHLVSELMAEFVVASVLPDEPNSSGIAGHARHALEKEAGLQILADGVAAEQSPTYGAFTAEMLLVADLVARAFGMPLAPPVMERLRAFERFVGVLADADGTVPAIGDDDEGRVLSLSHAREAGYPASVARAIAGHLGGAPSVPAASGDVPELRNALFPATEGVAPLAEGIHRHDAGGYCVVRETRAGRRVKLVLDHGPLGYLSIAAHGHADANAVELSLDDKPVFVDAGTYLYHSGGAWRDWFRGTGAHNTVRLAGLDQSTISGPFNWSHKANASLDRVVEGENWSLTARHDGYARRLGVEHVRTVSGVPAGIEILDRLEGAGAPEAEVIFQFAPGLDVSDVDGVWLVRRDGAVVTRLAFSQPGETTLASGGDEPGQGGWYSPNFGTKLSAPRLVWRGLLAAEGLRTTLSWG